MLLSLFLLLIRLAQGKQITRNAFARELRADGVTATTAASGSEPPCTATLGHHSHRYGDPQSSNDAQRLGADDLILKFHEVNDLISRIRLCLEKQSLLRLLALWCSKHLKKKAMRDERGSCSGKMISTINMIY